MCCVMATDKMAVLLATYGNGRGFVHNHHILVHVYDGDWMARYWHLVSETGITMPDTLYSVGLLVANRAVLVGVPIS